ncbi:protein stum homolog isoform X2 [Convolutriloba macropyga]|uniref:protein stum homolog isoform X2 n=1 Tax=Convolutriloba macropyga TaxID=536237 RepID=UPI003F51B478
MPKETDSTFSRAITYDAESQHRGEQQAGGKRRKSFYGHRVPILPFELAVLCCVLNVILPGIGTITSAILLLTIPYMSCRSYSCSPDVVEKMDGNPPIIIFIGCSQLILATCLIGWIWSIVWGGWIVQLACK